MLLPSLLKQCLANAPAAIAALDIILAAGDRFDGRDALEAQNLVQVNVYNAYGPTEKTVTNTIYAVKAEEDFVNGVPNGRAINNTGAYIVEAAVCDESTGVLGIEVGTAGNFFDLGGHSLMATELAARLSQYFHNLVLVTVMVDLAALIF